MTSDASMQHEHHRLAVIMPFIDLLRATGVPEHEIDRIFRHPMAQASSPHVKTLFDCLQKVKSFKPEIAPCDHTCFCSQKDNDFTTIRASEIAHQDEDVNDWENGETFERIEVDTIPRETNMGVENTFGMQFTNVIENLRCPPDSFKDIHQRKRRIKELLKRNRERQRDSIQGKKE